VNISLITLLQISRIRNAFNPYPDIQSMKKVIVFLFVLLILKQGKAQWWMTTSVDYNLETQYTTYKFTYTQYGMRDCIQNTWVVYCAETGERDTLNQVGQETNLFKFVNLKKTVNWHEYTLNFKRKGNYLIEIHSRDKCFKFKDTNYLIELPLPLMTGFYPTIEPISCNIKIYSWPSILKTDSGCNYYFRIYQSRYFDTMPSAVWDTITRPTIKHFYNFDSGRIFDNYTRRFSFKFPKDGRYLMIGNAMIGDNAGHRSDTIVYYKINIDCAGVGLKTIPKSEAQLLAVYDMLGRPVKNPRKDKILIYVYSDCTKKKQMVIE